MAKNPEKETATREIQTRRQYAEGRVPDAWCDEDRMHGSPFGRPLIADTAAPTSPAEIARIARYKKLVTFDPDEVL